MTCTWEPDTGCLGSTWDSLDDDVKERALLLATSTLQALTYNRVGTCPITIRPCPDNNRCGCGRWRGATVGSGGSFYPHMEADGRWYNSCCGSVCEPVSEIDLPGPVGYIDQFLVNGEPVDLDNGDWRLDDGHLLVWQGTGPSPVPSTQDLNKPDSEPGTWSITYSQSYPVDRTGRIAVGLLAKEYAEACKPKGKCSLPRGVTNVVRNGVTFTVEAGLFINGLTGIEAVDAFIVRWVPVGSPSAAAVVFDPRKIKSHRVTSTVPRRDLGSV